MRVAAMPDPSTASYFGLPGFVILWAAATLAIVVFLRRVLRLIAVLRLGRPEMRWDRIPQRVGHVLKNVFGQRRLFNEPAIGAAHFFIFWAFVFYASSFFWNLARALVPILPLPYLDEVPLVALVMELLTVAALVALAGAAVRRYVFTPPRLERTFDATLVLVLITVLLVTFLGGQAFKAAAAARASVWSPVGSFLGRILAGAGVSADSAETLYLSLWWAHMATVLFFLAYLPHSKHAHLLFSPFGVFFTSLRPGGMPPPSDGAARLDQFTWRQLFNALTCAMCGRCDRACPAFNSGFPLSPKMLIHGVKEVVLKADPAVVRGLASDGPAAKGSEAVRILGEHVTPADVWSCTTCLACMQLCPVFNEHVPLVIEMRRYMVSQGEVEERLQAAMQALSRYGNSFGKSPRARAKWTQGLGFEIKDARREPVEYLWFVGDYASYDPRLERVTRATARVLHHAGVDYGILNEGEQNSGNDVRRTGEEGLFEVLKE
jgi:heterodisulfide reductase subunit C